MNKPFYITTLALMFSVAQTHAQALYTTHANIDVNKINASALLHGDLWVNTIATEPDCEFPKGSGKHVMFGGALWMAGYDNTGSLHQSAQTYRQTGNDYWPGPLSANGTTNNALINAWAKIWKINKSDIDNFLSQSTHTISNTPTPVLQWPAKGNPYAVGNNTVLNVDKEMAPFIDVNTDGVYNPLHGDYPAMQGDQMLWWVMNDNGTAHNHSANNGLALKAEMHVKAYAYNRGTLADNMIFYEYKLINRSTNDYSAFRAGIWADCDLGYFQDDYIGFDSSHRRGYVYNGGTIDTNGTPDPTHYGANVPIAGVTLLRMPGDAIGSYVPAGSFVYYNNDIGVIGNPASDSDFDHYLRGELLNGQPIQNDFQGAGIPSRGYGMGPATKYVFDGDPSLDTEWSECTSSNAPGDRRFIISTNDFDFNAGSTQIFAFALLAADPAPGNTCPGVGLAGIKQIADTAWKIYNTSQSLAVNNIRSATQPLSIFPNPAKDVLNIKTSGVVTVQETMTVYDYTGKAMAVPMNKKGDTWQLGIQHLPAGIYQVRCKNGDTEYNGRFIKE